MKVTNIETHLVGLYTFVRVMTDEDLYGIGEVHPASGTGGTPFMAYLKKHRDDCVLDPVG